MQIEIVELRKACARLMDFLEQERGPTIEVGCDYYWVLVGLLDLDKKPREFGVGQASEDWEKLCSIAHGSRQPCYTDVQHLADLLSVIVATRHGCP